MKKRTTPIKSDCGCLQVIIDQWLEKANSTRDERLSGS